MKLIIGDCTISEDNTNWIFQQFGYGKRPNPKTGELEWGERVKRYPGSLTQALYMVIEFSANQSDVANARELAQLLRETKKAIVDTLESTVIKTERPI